jgi:hypothetical protein
MCPTVTPSRAPDAQCLTRASDDRVHRRDARHVRCTGITSEESTMHRSESRELASCLACGAEVVPGRDRAFALSPDRFLCFSCATQRGGSWDELHDHWTAEPETRDLPPLEE